MSKLVYFSLLLLVCHSTVRADDDDEFPTPAGWEVQDWTWKFHSSEGHAEEKQGSHKHTLQENKEKMGKKADQHVTQITDLIEEAKSLEETEDVHVSYLFLASAGLPLEWVWHAYFAGCPRGSFSVLVHQQQPAQLPGTFSIQKVSPENVVQGDLRFKYEMNQAMFAMLNQARGNQNSKFFQFLSDSCMPIRSCRELHNFLGQNDGISFVGNHPQTDQNFLMNQGRCWNGMQQYMRFSLPCMKSSQWVNLNRPHVELLLNTFIPEQQDFWRGTKVPDEHMIPTMFHQNGLPVTGYTLTYVKWPRNRWPEPAGWGDMPPQDPDCWTGDDNSHPCPIAVDDPHITSPSQHTFFARKIDPGLLQGNQDAAKQIMARYTGQSSLETATPDRKTSKKIEGFIHKKAKKKK